LGRELRALREAGGRTGNQFARDLGWAQSKISRLETATQTATEEDVRAWCGELRIPPGEVARLLQLLHQAEAEYLSWKDSYRLAGNAGRKQEEILRYEKLSRCIYEFQPCIVPGLFQTQAYASELLRVPAGPTLFGATQADIDDLIAVRMRRQESLYDGAKQISVVILEAVLQTHVCSRPVLVEQLLRLRELERFSKARLGIIPRDARVPIIPLGGFTIYDDDLVVLETLSGEQHLSERSEVAAYCAAATALRDASVKGDHAQALIDKALHEYVA
jgi:transcriptional regulator with XRE-family HTH domain